MYFVVFRDEDSGQVRSVKRPTMEAACRFVNKLQDEGMSGRIISEEARWAPKTPTKDA